jgi:GntR family transcriptional repressor for pyruvate dehydrogenase complex
MVQRQPRLSDRVAEAIVQAIVAQRLLPGDALPPERELGEQFGVSRTVIREAVRALDARGLLDVRVGSRIKVAAVDPKTVRDAISHFSRSSAMDGRTISEVSDALDIAAVGLAAEHATEEDLDRIDSALALLEDDPGDGATTAEAELAFRHAVLRATHNELLLVLADAVEMLSSATPQARHPDSGAERNRALATAIRRRDTDGARTAIRERFEHRVVGGTGDD